MSNDGGNCDIIDVVVPEKLLSFVCLFKFTFKDSRLHQPYVTYCLPRSVYIAV